MLDNKLVESLIQIMKYECKAYSGILKIAEKKTDCLVRNDVSALSAITEQENKAAGQTEQLNQAREQIVSKLCEQMGEDYKTFNLKRLMEKVNEEYKKQLEETGSKLSQIVHKLTARNEINQKLIENALKYIDFNMHLLSSPQPEAPVYGRTGNEVSNSVKRSVLDIKF